MIAVIECPHGYPETELHRCAFCKRNVSLDRKISVLGAHDWERAAKKVIWEWARSGRQFTAEDVTDIVGVPDVTHRPNGRNNRIGILFNTLVKPYGLRHVDLAKARNPQANGRTIKVWQGREHR